MKHAAYFEAEPFTRREAWKWLLSHAEDGRIRYSIRHMAAEWKWHRSKVERFLLWLTSESYMKRISEAGKNNVFVLCFRENSASTLSTKETSLETNTETHERQMPSQLEATRENRDSCEDRKTCSERSMAEISETSAGHFQNNAVSKEEEKKKGKTKRKKEAKKEKKKGREKKEEENQKNKEKPIPYGNSQKETKKGIAANHIDHMVDWRDVQVSDVEAWAIENLAIPIDLDWELEKFKDYIQAGFKRPPQDGIAAFRRWLRNAVRFQQRAGRYPAQSNANSQKPNAIDRFMREGMKAILSIEHQDQAA